MDSTNRDRLLSVYTLKIICCLPIFIIVTACTQPIQRKDGSISLRPFTPKEIIKNEINNITEIHQQEVIASLKALTLKLYRRNPQEWRKSHFENAESATEALYKTLLQWHLYSSTDWQASLHNSWREDYADDRVQALMFGLLVMNMASYNHKTEFYILSSVDAQKLYNSARNIEAVVWKLSNARKKNGELILISNSADPQDVNNLSFEREFGKIIGIQDVLARSVENKSIRSIRFAVVNLAVMIFLPIP